MTAREMFHQDKELAAAASQMVSSPVFEKLVLHAKAEMFANVGLSREEIRGAGMFLGYLQQMPLPIEEEDARPMVELVYDALENHKKSNPKNAS